MLNLEILKNFIVLKVFIKLISPKPDKKQNKTKLLFMANIHTPIIHSSVDGLLGCFHVLDIVNSASVNIGVHVCRRNKIGSFVEMWMDLESVI